MPPSPPIRIRGARQNKLKNIDLDIPAGELVVVTGPSGSGKSSVEAQRLKLAGHLAAYASKSATMAQV